MRSNSFRTTAAFILTTLMLVVAAANTLATAQTYTDLYNFSNNGGPNDPQWCGIIAQGRDGNLYSTTNQNWTGGPGDVFKITPTGTLTVLHNFDGTDGEAPVSGLTLATNGSFYGTTAYGASGYGTIFSITAGGKLTTLYSFTNGADGGVPQAPPIQGLDGNLYGITTGIDGNNGSVYKITPSGVFTTLHSFDGTDGANPLCPLVQATKGDFYGTTYLGGTNGAGTIFRISPSGTFKVLYNFGQVPGYPYGSLIQGSDGNFYGVTTGDSGSGSAGGVAFKITPGGTLTTLHTFTCGSDGCNQVGGLVQATDGNFYGTNNIGGNGGEGTIFRITSTGTFATLYSFDNFGVGANPQNTLLQRTSGFLYGEGVIGGTSDMGVFYSFDVGLGPFVSFLPAAGKVGRTVEFLGQGFTGTTAVSFNGTAATFTVVRDTYLTATVPSGATTGFVTVATPSGTLTSNKEFRVTQ